MDDERKPLHILDVDFGEGYGGSVTLNIYDDSLHYIQRLAYKTLVEHLSA